tara:strand:+ start:53 stop:568 length:516 start_codon:yes stop_codon:yes gene_type:complete
MEANKKEEIDKYSFYEVFPKHGDIIRNGQEGNGYHGRCSNCNLALVTDLGYNSWEGVECKAVKLTRAGKIRKTKQEYQKLVKEDLEKQKSKVELRKRRGVFMLDKPWLNSLGHRVYHKPRFTAKEIIRDFVVKSVHLKTPENTYTLIKDEVTVEMGEYKLVRYLVFGDFNA